MILEELVSIVKTVADPASVAKAADTVRNGVENKLPGIVGKIQDVFGGKQMQHAVEGMNEHVEAAAKGLSQIMGSEAAEAAEGLAGSIGMVGSALKLLTNPITIAIAAIGALVGAFTLMARSIAEATAEAHELAILGELMGSNAEEADAFIDAFTGIGVSSEAAAGMLKTFAKNVAEASRGMGRAKMVFESYGIAVKDASGKMRSANEVMDDVRAKMTSGKLSRAEQESMADKLGLGPEFLKTLDHNMAYIKEQQEAIGEAFTPKDTLATLDELSKSYRAAGDEIRLLGTVWSKIWQGMAARVGPMFAELTDGFSSVLRGIRETLVKNAPAITKAIDFITRLFGIVGKVLLGVFTALSGVFSIAMKLVSAFVSMWGLLQSIGGWLDDKSGGRIGALLDVLVDLLDLIPEIPVLFDIALEEIAEHWKGIVKTILEFPQTLMNLLRDAFKIAWDAARVFGQIFLDWITEKFTALGQKLASIITAPARYLAEKIGIEDKTVLLNSAAPLAPEAVTGGGVQAQAVANTDNSRAQNNQVTVTQTFTGNADPIKVREATGAGINQGLRAAAVPRG